MAQAQFFRELVEGEREQRKFVPAHDGDSLLQIAGGGIDAPVLHVTNAGTASRFEQARAVFEELGADPDRVRPVGTAAVPRPARRPVFSALSMAESVRAGLTPLRPWREALAEAVAVPIQQ